ncbi:transglycosylase family protein [Streptomyces sp. TRM 70351]|uniref:transglycosylase family protein n=1 Tax=Streptomyces sp. TRM 70351 TaxID=3116552 RepID=UPI002E7B9787|nr:transglycosylase family protein [Streptomyces sp. TRM 70351]MEE1929274.1 transglycosylase family protein [Streptomyces sp. TRM 70351]
MSIRRGKAVRAGALSLAAATPLALLALASGPAQAADAGVWDRLAQCESGGNWQINTGNGYYGGLQFSASTWAAFGGTAYASTADRASRAQQIEIASKVQAGQGWGAWPACSARLGLQGSPPASSGAQAPAQQPEAAQPSRQAAPPRDSGSAANRSAPRTGHDHPQANYTVKAGDTLSLIARAHGADWRAVYEENTDVIGADPDVIRPGQRLKV